MERKDIDEIADLYAAVFHNLKTKGGFISSSELVSVYKYDHWGPKLAKQFFNNQSYYNYYRVVRAPNDNEDDEVKTENDEEFDLKIEKIPKRPTLQLGYPELAKIASYLDHRTLIKFRHASRKLKISYLFGAIEAYEASLKNDEDRVYGDMAALSEVLAKVDRAKLQEARKKVFYEACEVDGFGVLSCTMEAEEQNNPQLFDMLYLLRLVQSLQNGREVDEEYKGKVRKQINYCVIDFADKKHYETFLEMDFVWGEISCANN